MTRLAGAECSVIIESRLLEARPVMDQTLDQAAVLRAFDDLRRGVARRVAGEEGIFVGFNQLDFDSRPEAAGEIAVTAVLVDHSPTWHSAYYQAFMTRDRFMKSVRTASVARGSGTTVTPRTSCL
ncbi:hypothetical protein JCM18899A_31630 [Nocardioides sp. AN3]